MTCLASSISKLRKTSLWLFKKTKGKINLQQMMIYLTLCPLTSAESVFRKKPMSTILSLANEFPLIIRSVKT